MSSNTLGLLGLAPLGVSRDQAVIRDLVGNQPLGAHVVEHALGLLGLAPLGVSRDQAVVRDLVGNQPLGAMSSNTRWACSGLPRLA